MSSFLFFVFVYIKTKVKPCLDKKTMELIKMLTRLIATGATPHQMAEIVMQDIDLKHAVKAALLKDVDEQCKKLCKRTAESSSVLRVPRSKHKVILIPMLNNFMDKILQNFQIQVEFPQISQTIISHNL